MSDCEGAADWYPPNIGKTNSTYTPRGGIRIIYMADSTERRKSQTALIAVGYHGAFEVRKKSEKRL